MFTCLPLTCLATGFYPKHIEMKITLNDRNLEPFNSTGVRPNENETFQMRISVEIHRDEKQCIECHVAHSNWTNTALWGKYNHINSQKLLCAKLLLFGFLTATPVSVMAAQMNFINIVVISLHVTKFSCI